MPHDQPLNGLKNAIQQRQEALQAASGELGMPMPPSAPTQPVPASMSVQQPSPALAGLQGAAPRLEMSPEERAQFSQQTGVQFNPFAADIPLGLNDRADSLINRYR